MATLIVASYDDWLVALSFVIAFVTSYTTLDLAARVTANHGIHRVMWLLGGAFAMGSGIWCMHYTGMLAFRLPIPVYYHLPKVLLSMLAAIVASYIALLVVTRDRMTTQDLLAGSVIDRRLSAQQLELDREREMLRALLDNIPDLMYVKDTESRFVLANPQVAMLMGVTTADELIGKTAFDFLPGEWVTPSYEMEQKVSVPARRYSTMKKCYRIVTAIKCRSSPRRCLSATATAMSPGLQVWDAISASEKRMRRR
jgi:PAS domain-containing protein